jgi:hypothetical protein
MRPNAVNHVFHADITRVIATTTRLSFSTWSISTLSLVLSPPAPTQKPASSLVALQHAIHQVSERPPEVFASVGQPMLVDEQHIVLEACVEVWL